MHKWIKPDEMNTGGEPNRVVGGQHYPVAMDQAHESMNTGETNQTFTVIWHFCFFLDVWFCSFLLGGLQKTVSFSLP